MNNVKFEYVASGFSYFRINKQNALTPEIIDYFKNTFASINGNHNHLVSLLYNAYTEANHGEMFNSTIRPIVNKIHADSGGLQMITLGKTITEELKMEIYANQAKYSDIAMAFDMIPVKVLGDRSVRLDTNTRKFDPANFENCARQSGKNLKTQIEYFLKNKSKSKPFLITQGNCYDTYMKWVEYVVEELPSEYIDHIGGIAMGAAALGKGTLEDIKRAFYYTQLPIKLKNNHMHLLGVGAFPRMIPTLVFVQNELYNNMVISYDSTTHTASITRGLYFYKTKMLNYSRVMNPDYDTIFEDINNNFPGVYEFDVNMLHACLNNPPSKIAEKYGSSDASVKTAISYISSAIKNFAKCVDHMSTNQKDMIRLLSPLYQNAFLSLYEVKNMDDFNHWLRSVGNHIDSDALGVYNSGLSHLFGE
jgi:hypothetical protein